MKVIYVDDERNAIKNFELEVKEREVVKSVHGFDDPYDALAYVEAHSQEVDVAFLDITMPGMDGITLARKIKDIKESIEIVYVTGYSSYALDAYKIGAISYLMKPYSDEELDRVLQILERLIKKIRIVKEPVSPEHTAITTQNQEHTVDVYMRTFGAFDMLVDGYSVRFKNAKAKELLALLVDHRGGNLTSNQIFDYLWEDKFYDAVTSTYVRRTLKALHGQLKDLGVEDILCDRRNAKSVDVTKFQCDYYEVMNNERTHLFEYNGYYMSQYAWAEETVGIIEGKVMMLKHKGNDWNRVE